MAKFDWSYHIAIKRHVDATEKFDWDSYIANRYVDVTAKKKKKKRHAKKAPHKKR